MKNTNTINEFFGNISHYYFNNKKSITTLPAETLNLSDFALYKVDSITFKKDSPKREALEKSNDILLHFSNFRSNDLISYLFIIYISSFLSF